MADLAEQAKARRRAATRAAIKYFALAFISVVILASLVTYALWSNQRQRADSRAIRVAYCTELEKLKTQNREDVEQDKKDYKRNLRLLHLQDTPELRRVAEKHWKHELERNAPRSCPYRPA